MNLFSATIVAQALRTSVPFAAAALGGIWCERSGVITIALEGMLLVGAFATAIVDVLSGNPWYGLLAGAAAAAAVGFVHALFVEVGRIHGVISGLALNLAAFGGTRFFLRMCFNSTSNSPAVGGFRVLEGGGTLLLLARSVLQPTTLLLLLALGATTVLFRTTPFGLRLRAVGENPGAARALGVSVRATRALACTVGGAIVGIGGAALAFDQHQFQSGMSAGRGFMALAAVILSGWQAPRAMLFCLTFAVLDALQIGAQGLSRASGDVLTMLPYLLTLLAMFVLGRGRRGIRAPAGLGASSES